MTSCEHQVSFAWPESQTANLLYISIAISQVNYSLQLMGSDRKCRAGFPLATLGRHYSPRDRIGNCPLVWCLSGICYTGALT